MSVSILGRGVVLPFASAHLYVRLSFFFFTCGILLRLSIFLPSVFPDSTLSDSFSFFPPSFAAPCINARPLLVGDLCYAVRGFLGLFTFLNASIPRISFNVALMHPLDGSITARSRLFLQPFAVFPLLPSTMAWLAIPSSFAAKIHLCPPPKSPRIIKEFFFLLCADLDEALTYDQFGPCRIVYGGIGVW